MPGRWLEQMCRSGGDVVEMSATGWDGEEVTRYVANVGQTEMKTMGGMCSGWPWSLNSDDRKQTRLSTSVSDVLFSGSIFTHLDCYTHHGMHVLPGRISLAHASIQTQRQHDTLEQS